MLAAKRPFADRRFEREDSSLEDSVMQGRRSTANQCGEVRYNCQSLQMHVS